MKNDNWFLNQQHLYYLKRADFDRDLATRNIHKKSVAFIDEGKLIWTQGKFWQCDNTEWEKTIQFIKGLYFYTTSNPDGSITYELRGTDASGNPFSTDASFTLLKDVFIKNAELIDDGKTLRITLNNDQIIDIDLSKLLQLNDFLNTPSVEFVLEQDPDNTANTTVKAYARQLISATNPNVKVVAGDNIVISGSEDTSITVGNGDIFVEGENTRISSEVIELNSSGEVNITSEGNVNVQGSSVSITGTNGDIILEASDGNSVKVNSPLFVSEEYPDVNQALIDINERIDTGSDLTAGNGISIANGKISVKDDEYFEPPLYWDN